MQKSLDAIMSHTLKATSAKAKAGSENKSNPGADAPMGLTNAFSNLLDRVMQKNQPKTKNNEAKIALKEAEKAIRKAEQQNNRTGTKHEGISTPPRTNQLQSASTHPSEAADHSAQEPITDADESPTTIADETSGTEALTQAPAAQLSELETDPAPTQQDRAEDVLEESAPILPDVASNMDLLLTLQQPLGLGLYQSIHATQANLSSPAESDTSNPDEIISQSQGPLSGEPSSPLPVLSTLINITPAFGIQNPISQNNLEFGTIQASATETVEITPSFPNADTLLPLSQAPEAPSQSLADNPISGSTALPGTALATSASASIQVDTAVDMGQPSVILDTPASLENLGGALEISDDSTVVANPASNLLSTQTISPLENPVEFVTNAALLAEQNGELTIKPASPESSVNSFGLQTEQAAAATDNMSPTLQTPFANLLEQAGGELMETLPEGAEIQIESSEATSLSNPEIPTSLPDLSQTPTGQQTTGAFSNTSTEIGNPIAQFTSTAGSPAEQVAEGAVYSLKQGQRELIIRLNPDNLGEVRINLTRHGANELSARLIASTPESHDLLQSQLDSLKQNLEAQGIRVERLSVIMAGGSETQTQNNHSQHQQTGQQQADRNIGNQPQSSGQGQPEQNAFAQTAGNQSQHKHGTSQGHRAPFPQQANPTWTEHVSKPENQARQNANGNISILV
jgi:hypothetical protein